MSNTCTAPGHSSCSITCSDGCYAIYSEPDGPCSTGCTGNLAEIDDSEGTFSIQINGLRPADLNVLLGAASPAAFLADTRTDGPISFSGSGLTRSALAEQLAAM